MYRYSRLAVALASLTLVLAGAPAAARSAAADPKSTIDENPKELVQVPDYRVFDFLAFKYDKGTVTLVGYAYRPTLKTDAVRAVKRVAGVDQVIDKIEEL